MYNLFFGLRRDPFSLTPDPEFLYLTPQHREALAGLSYAILSGKGFVVLTGSAGSGKTTLVTSMMQHLPAARVRYGLILNPTLSASEFLEATMMDFGLTNIPTSKAQRISIFQNFLRDVHMAGQLAALIVDEAHKLSTDVLEEIRLLGNFESAREKLLQVALVGQTELDEILNLHELRQLKQRIARRMTIQPLEPDEVGPYIQHRWKVAGGKSAPFSAEAVTALRHATGGVPRIINVVCDSALVEAFGDESPLVERRHILAACRDLQLAVPLSLPPAAFQLPANLEQVTVPDADIYPMKTLERYNVSATQRPSFLRRLRSRFAS